MSDQVTPKGKAKRTPKRPPFYGVWQAMKQRCLCTTHKCYADYGGRGINVCQRWRDSYNDFIADMGLRPGDGYSIDRIKNDLNYSCGKCAECVANGWQMNCRWATHIEQDNNKRTNVFIERDGRTQSLKQWTRELGLHYRKTHKRLTYKDITASDLFDELLNAAGPRPEGYVLDTISTSTGYRAGNVKWMKPGEGHKRAGRLMVTHNGETLCFKDWTVKLNLNYVTAFGRMKKNNKTPHAALELPEPDRT